MQTSISLSTLFTRNGSDKNTDHSYGPFYSELAEILLLRNKLLHLLEIGVEKGAGIRALHTFFGNRAVIYGVDRNVDSIRSLGASVKPLVADQSIRSSLENLRSQFQQQEVLLDLIIDDASHAKADQLLTAEVLHPLLAPGGYYVIEDLQHQESAKLFAHLPGFRLIDLRDIKNRCDDMLVVLHRPLILRE